MLLPFDFVAVLVFNEQWISVFILICNDWGATDWCFDLCNVFFSLLHLLLLVINACYKCVMYLGFVHHWMTTLLFFGLIRYYKNCEKKIRERKEKWCEKREEREVSKNKRMEREKVISAIPLPKYLLPNFCAHPQLIKIGRERREKKNWIVEISLPK